MFMHHQNTTESGEKNVRVWSGWCVLCCEVVYVVYVVYVMCALWCVNQRKSLCVCARYGGVLSCVACRVGCLVCCVLGAVLCLACVWRMRVTNY